MAAYTPFDQQNGDQFAGSLGGLSYRRPRQLEFNPQSGQWEDSQMSPDAYDKKYASNEERGAFKTFGTVQDNGPDNSTEAERQALSPMGNGPQFYGGATGNNGPLQGLRDAIAAAAKAKKGV